MKNNSNKRYLAIPVALLEEEILSLSATVILSFIIGLEKNNLPVRVSNDKLAQYIKGSKSTVKRAKKELVELGLITIVQEEKGRGNLATIKVNKKNVNNFLGIDYFNTGKVATPAIPTQSDYYNNKRKK